MRTCQYQSKSVCARSYIATALTGSMVTVLAGTCALAGAPSRVSTRTTSSSARCRASTFAIQRDVCRRRSTTIRRHRIQCSADNFEEGELLKGVKAGDKLKVKESRTVWHSPKHKVFSHACAQSSLWQKSVLTLLARFNWLYQHRTMLQVFT